MMRPFYDEDGITIHLGDCREVLPILGPVDHVITDPPYEAEAHTLQRRVKPGGGVMECELSFAPMWGGLRDFIGLKAGLMVRRWVLTFCQIEAAPLWRAAYETQGGLVYRRTCIWVKPDGMPQYSGDRPGMGYETILAMHKEGASAWNGGGKHGVFIFNKADGAGPNPHPTTKPLPLMKELVALFTDSGETILDPFCGSGTTLRAAKDLGRKAIGIEIDEKYCEIAVRRLNQMVLGL